VFFVLQSSGAQRIFDHLVFKIKVKIGSGVAGFLNSGDRLKFTDVSGRLVGYIVWFFVKLDDKADKTSRIVLNCVQFAPRKMTQAPDGNKRHGGILKHCKGKFFPCTNRNSA
jgi:hypothetical protein